MDFQRVDKIAFVPIAPVLHDGRAATVTDAILAHAGQGAAARNRFATLHPDLKAKLLAFLNSL
ncbi:MAG: di-heme oxidoredictase family protein [Thermoanaerobaculia bacterium]